MRVPRWRTMMAPACTWPPSNTFTPRRCAWESRPFLVDPPPFVLLIGDPRDLDRVVVLAVAPPVALVGLVLVGEAADLGALGLAHHPSGHLGRGKVGRGGHDVVAVDQEHRREVHLVALGLAEQLDVEPLAL